MTQDLGQSATVFAYPAETSQDSAKVALFQKGRKTLLAGLKDGSLERLVSEMEKQKAMVAAELDAFEKMDLKVVDFIKEFRTNEKLLQKVSLSTGLAISDLSGLQDADLIKWFEDMDTDCSGTLSFDEFVEGIMKVREEQMSSDQRTAKVALFQKGRKTLLAGLKDGSLERVVGEMEKQKAMIAAELDAFEKMDLKVAEFIKEFRNNEKLLQKVSLSTGLATSDLSNLQDVDLIRWFQDMDTDGSGTLSFDEFVEGIMKVREEQMATDKRTAKVALFQKGRKSLLAGLRDGSLERVVDKMENDEAKRQRTEGDSK
jgi:Ca2+-binding EF-hand superfamily protein